MSRRNATAGGWTSRRGQRSDYPAGTSRPSRTAPRTSLARPSRSKGGSRPRQGPDRLREAVDRCVPSGGTSTSPGRRAPGGMERDLGTVVALPSQRLRGSCQAPGRNTPKAARATGICKPEVTGSIPVRSIYERPCKRAFRGRSVQRVSSLHLSRCGVLQAQGWHLGPSCWSGFGQGGGRRHQHRF